MSEHDCCKTSTYLSDDTVREYARTIAGWITSDARSLYGPVVWITDNNFMPPLRAIPLAEEVWQADNNDTGELFAFLTEEIERHLAAEDVALECPEYDNSLYAVDLRRWQYKEPEEAEAAEDLNDMFEPAETGDGTGR